MNPYNKHTLINLPPIPQHNPFGQHTNDQSKHSNNHNPFVSLSTLHTYPLSSTFTVLITIFAILVTNKFMYSPPSLGPNFKSVRFFGVMLVNLSIGFVMFFIIKFNKSMTFFTYRYIAGLALVNSALMFHFYIHQNTHTAFDDFIQTLMFTYNSEYIDPATPQKTNTTVRFVPESSTLQHSTK